MIIVDPWEAWRLWFALFLPPPPPPCIERRGNVIYVDRSVWRDNGEPSGCRAEHRHKAAR